jgi:pimeloyl-ACP methyl ester carboxylesterase
VPTNGIELNVAEIGQGPLVFLLHGFPESWVSWAPQIKFLVNRGYRVVAPELRGYGDSDAPQAWEAYDTVELTADVVGLLDAYGEDQGLIIGHDWGCIVGWNTAWLHPDRVKGVGGLSVPWFGRGSVSPIRAFEQQFGDKYFYILDFQRHALDEQLDADIAESVHRMLAGRMDMMFQPGDSRRFLDRISIPAQRPDYLDQAFLDYVASRYQRHGFRPCLNWYRNMHRNWERTASMPDNLIKPPAMYLAGKKDWTVSYADMIGLDQASMFSDLRISEVIDAGHWLMQETPEWVNHHILAFLEGLAH